MELRVVVKTAKYPPKRRVDSARVPDPHHVSKHLRREPRHHAPNMIYAAAACFGALVAPPMSLRAPAATRASAPRMDLDKGTLNVGVVGAGRICVVHLEAIASCNNARAIIISNPTVSKAEAAVERFPGTIATSDEKDVIHHPDVEAVWLCSPSQFHAAQIKACADAGKHIFCEKPLATDLIETIEAVNYARKKGVKLMTALQRRFDPNFLRIKQARLRPSLHLTILCAPNAAVPRTHSFRPLTRARLSLAGHRLGRDRRRDHRQALLARPGATTH